MEIIHVVLGKANPARMNGVNKVVNELASQQAAAGAGTISLWGISHSLQHDYPERNYTTVLFKAYKNKFRLDRNIAGALDNYTKNTIFHLHGGFIPTFYSLSKELKKRNLPFVLTAHGSYNTIAMQKGAWQKRIYFPLFECKLLRAATFIHCLGKSEMNGLQQLYPNNKSALIPYGFEGMNGVQQLQPHKNFIIGFCGRLDIHTKGLEVLLTAFAKFSSEVPASELWIIGDSTEKYLLEDMAKELGILRRITFWGAKYGDEKLELLQQLHVFAHPSRNEGLPTAVLEAASLGIPCAITEATNVGDAVRKFNCGEVIAGTDASLLQQAFIKLYRHIRLHGMNELSNNARHMIRECYSWKNILQEFHQLYTKGC